MQFKIKPTITNQEKNIQFDIKHYNHKSHNLKLQLKHILLNELQVTYALCMVAGVGGNVITLLTMATADRKNKTVTNIFLISLTVRKNN